MRKIPLMQNCLQSRCVGDPRRRDEPLRPIIAWLLGPGHNVGRHHSAVAAQSPLPSNERGARLHDTIVVLVLPPLGITIGADSTGDSSRVFSVVPRGVDALSPRSSGLPFPALEG